MIIKGTVIDTPFSGNIGYENYWIESTLFLVELSRDVTATFKKVDPVLLRQGETVVVVGIVGCYGRKNDQIEIKGQIGKAVLDDRERGESIFIKANKMYNETLKFSLSY